MLRRPPAPFSETEDGKRLAALSAVIVGTASAVLAHTLTWPARVALFAAVATAVRWALWFAARRLGEGRLATLVSRGINTFIFALISGMVVGSVLWAVTGHDPGWVGILGPAVVLLPAWWLFLAWWEATSPTATIHQ